VGLSQLGFAVKACSHWMWTEVHVGIVYTDALALLRWG